MNAAKTRSSLFIRKLTYSALCLALAIVLPFLTGQIPQIGSMLCPMHIPALLCGFLCGWQYGAVVGFVSPLLRMLMFGMPPVYVAIAMAFELAVYGAISGLLYRAFPKNVASIYLSLLTAMIAGQTCLGCGQVRYGRHSAYGILIRTFPQRSCYNRHSRHHSPDSAHPRACHGCGEGKART